MAIEITESSELASFGEKNIEFFNKMKYRIFREGSTIKTDFF
tara:strand:- start:669 stop:794 length:126 start_codon:yes stop_codon:yes gene_type:complete